MRIKATKLTILSQADLVFLLADLLRPPPERPSAPRTPALDDLDDLLACAGFSQRLGLSLALKEAVLAAGVAETDCWLDEYRRLFDAPMRCPANETAYVRRDKGAVIGDICGFYTAFGFAVNRTSGEKPDHIVTELEFVGLLLAMLACAPDEARAQIVRQGLREFADVHVGEWLASFVARLENLSELVLFADIARSLGELWSALAEVHGLRAQPQRVLSPEPEPDEPYECGMVPAAGTVEMRVRGHALEAVPR